MPGIDPKLKSEKNSTTISGLELKQLFHQLLMDSKISVRIRVPGEMWMQNFTSVHAVQDKTALLYDPLENRYHLVRFNGIMQFEIDQRFQVYQPHCHYNVNPSQELE